MQKVERLIPTGWQKTRLGKLGSFSKGGGIARSELTPIGHNAIRYGELYMTHHFKVKAIHSYIPDGAINATKSIKYGDILFAGSGETIEEIGKSAAYLMSEPCYAGGDIIIFSPKNSDSLFLSYLLNTHCRKQLSELGQGQSVVHIYKRDLEKLNLTIPPLPEQTRIVAVLETWENAIEKLTQKIELKKAIKKGLMRKLLTGQVRLKGFSEKWRMKKLGELLDYEQPTKYLVTETNYNNNHNTPVLTAGKTFILGYTEEMDGIFRKLPTIIFDDFTTANKYVNFPFKAKSSAMKMLIPRNKNVNLKFVFEKMQLIDFQFKDHKRYWISEYQNIEIATPSPEEQTAIANILTAADQEIEAIKKKLALLEEQKKFLLNNLVTGKIRVPASKK